MKATTVTTTTKLNKQWKLKYSVKPWNLFLFSLTTTHPVWPCSFGRQVNPFKFLSMKEDFLLIARQNNYENKLWNPNPNCEPWKPNLTDKYLAFIGHVADWFPPQSDLFLWACWLESCHYTRFGAITIQNLLFFNNINHTCFCCSLPLFWVKSGL